MGSWINSAVDLVALHPGWALAIAFAAAVIEAVAVLGIIVPGPPIVVAVAAAAAAAGQSLLPYLVLVILGGILGDLVSYWLGYRFHDRIGRIWPFSRRPSLLADASRFFARWGFYSVVLCRFLPVLRSTVPLVAGMAGMCRRRFLLANLCSALIWAPVHVFPGQIAGLTLAHLADGDWRGATILGSALLAVAAVIWLLHRKFIGQARPAA
ncbi:MAG: DedA family protein [Acetobacteraceae bacterium]